MAIEHKPVERGATRCYNICFTLTMAEAAALKALARERGTSMSDVCRELVAVAT